MSCTDHNESQKPNEQERHAFHDAPPPWLLRNGPSSPTSHLRKGQASPSSKLSVGTASPNSPCASKQDFGLLDACSPCCLQVGTRETIVQVDTVPVFETRPKSNRRIGDDVSVFRTDGSWSNGILKDIQGGAVTITLEDGREKRIPANLVDAQVKPRRGSTSTPQHVLSDKWATHQPVRVLRTNGSWSEGVIAYVQRDFILVTLDEGGDKTIPAHMVDTCLVPSVHQEAQEERFKFKINDVVTWNAVDDDIPSGTKGVVCGFRGAFVTVQFPKGTWSLLPFGLMKADPWLSDRP